MGLRGEGVGKRVRVEVLARFCNSVTVAGREGDSLHGVANISGRGAVWRARLAGGQEVAGSNPVAPTLLTV